MTTISPQTSVVTNVVKFVDCCTGTEIFFRGSLPVVDGSVYSYIGASPFTGGGGDLLTNGCYTLFNIYLEVIPGYPSVPTMAVLSNVSKLGCTDPVCLPCTQPLPCDCPEGYVQSGDLCVKEVVTSATYSGGLFTLLKAPGNPSYSNSGIRLYPDISSLTWPVLGTGPSNPLYTLNENNGAGAAVIPLTNLQSEVWGGTSPCPSGSTGGRLNIAGVWATGYPINTELSFEFCITIDGIEPKQYMLGIAGDNYVKFYIDGNLAVFLNAPTSAINIPFAKWHVFPITLTPGTHIIKLAGLNLGGAASFAAEIYNTTLLNFQANLMAPAVSAVNCGTSAATLEPYIIFSTRDMVGQQVANPSLPGVWSCPPGATLDQCSGVPTCVTREELKVVCACYMLIPCDSTEPFVSNNQDFDLLINTFVSVTSELYIGTVYVALLTDNTCSESIPVVITDTPVDPCPLTCYYVQHSKGVLYVDANDDLQEISSIDAQPFVKICSKVYPVVDTSSVDYLIVDLGLCDENGCPQKCYKLISCDDKANVIYTNSDSVLPYLYGTNQVVQVAGQEGCWTVSTLSDGDICDCPIDVIITSSYVDCISCTGYTSYKLTNCNGTDVIYTLDDLSAYLNSTIKIHCGCYTIEQLDILPPNPQTIIVEHTFGTCVECLRPYWKLVDCLSVAEDIYTYTDVSAYIGKVIKVEGCETCWQVESTAYPINPTVVNVALEFVDCETCYVDIPCQCSTMTNLSNVDRTYEYLDCEYNFVELTLAPSQTSDKICAIQWYAKGYCDCFIVKLTEVYNPELPPITFAFTATANGDMLNGYPVYDLCTPAGDCGIVSFNGTSWVIYDPVGAPLYILQILTSSTCPYGTWVGYDGNPIPNITIESYACNVTCNCIDLQITIPGEDGITENFTIDHYDNNGYPVYVSQDQRWEISFNPKNNCWEAINGGQTVVTICDVDCPVGVWSTVYPTSNTYTSTNCTVPPIEPDLLITDFIEYFGICQQGVCPPPVFKNNRTVRPGYNTPICRPEKYDMITCHFADILYRIALEKRYGITNCCPEEDDKWLVQKELIDLQALKDPNYICPDCPCSCNSGKTHSTCNCGI